MSDTNSAQPEEAPFRSVFLAALILPIVTEILSVFLARAVQSAIEFGPQGIIQNEDLVSLFDNSLSLILFVVLFFGIFYFLGKRLRLNISRDYARLLWYLLLGGALGNIIGYIVSVWAFSAVYGIQFGLDVLGLGTVANRINFVL